MRRLTLIAIAVLIACASLLALGCERYEPQTTSKQAEQYYQEKYSEKATVSDSHGLGNYALFGYHYGGTEYIMSDGTSVVYLDSEEMFFDNRQTDEIRVAAREFATSKIQGIPGALIPLGHVEVGSEPSFETYKGEGACWHERYTGDIETFLKAERPWLSLETYYSGDTYQEGRFFYAMAYDSAQTAGLEDAYLDLAKYFTMSSVHVAVVDRDAFTPSDLSLFDEGLRYVITFKETGTSAAIARFKPVFVDLIDGATISSQIPGVVLQAGDVRFEDAGDGFYHCRISGEAAGRSMEYYIRNDGPTGITLVQDIDSFSHVCNPYEHTSYSKLSDGATYYLGNLDDIKPYVEIESVTNDKVVLRYHTHFKDRINRIEFETIGFAYKNGSTSSETVRFESRVLEELDDGWRCEVDIRNDARPDNTFYFQFTYNNDDNISVQIEQAVQLPL